MSYTYLYTSIYIYIIPWEKHMNDFYSQVAIHKKTNNKKTNKWVQWTNEFFDALQPVIKNHSSTFHGMMFFNFIHTMIFSHWTIHFKDWKPFAALNCEALSFVSLIGRTIDFHSRSFSMYEINILLFTALELNFITEETNKKKVTD